jgi:hypothetical protein
MPAMPAMPDPFAGATDEHAPDVEPDATTEPEATAEPEREPEPVAGPEPEPELARHEAAPPAETASDDDNGRDRGAMLRLFSALRDT